MDITLLFPASRIPFQAQSFFLFFLPNYKPNRELLSFRLNCVIIKSHETSRYLSHRGVCIRFSFVIASYRRVGVQTQFLHWDLPETATQTHKHTDQTHWCRAGCDEYKRIVLCRAEKRHMLHNFPEKHKGNKVLGKRLSLIAYFKWQLSTVTR